LQVIRYFALSPALRPAMAMLNLPSEAAIICLIAIFTGLYGAIAAFPVLIGLDLTAAQVTSICAIMLIAQAIPVEQAIVCRAGCLRARRGLLHGMAGESILRFQR
jgi:spore maturation protein SpmB